MLRLVLLIAVIALFVDAFFYSGAYTQSAIGQVWLAADQLKEFVASTVDYGPEGDGSP